MSHREALHKLFAIAPPTIEEIIAQENSRENADRVEETKPVKTSLKRVAETVNTLDDSPSPKEQQTASMHVSKRLKPSTTKAKASSVSNLRDPRLHQQPVVNNQVQPPTCSNKRKEFDLSDPEQKTCKKLKPTEVNIISKPTPTNKIPGKIAMTPPSSLGATPITSPTSTTAPKEVFSIDKVLAIIQNPPVTKSVSISPSSPKTAVAASSMERKSSEPTLLPSPASKSSASPPVHKSSASPPQTVAAGTATSSSMARASSSPTFLLPSAHKSNAAPPVSLDSIVPFRSSGSGLPPPPPSASTSAAPVKNIPVSEAPHQLSSATASFLSSLVPTPALPPVSNTCQAKPIDPTPLKNVPIPEALSSVTASFLSGLAPTPALPPVSNTSQANPIEQTPPKAAGPKLSGRARKRNKKKIELAKKAAKRHLDVPKATDECDFDTLLKQFEEASSKSNTTGNSGAKNNKSNLPKQASASAATQNPPVQKPPSQKPVANQRPLVRPDQQNKAGQNRRVVSNQGVLPDQRVAFNKRVVPNQTGSSNQPKAPNQRIVPNPPKAAPNQQQKAPTQATSVPAAAAAHNNIKSTVVCQFFKTGSCLQGPECRFSHDLKLEPCRFYHMKGSCEQGPSCPYSHGQLTQDKLDRLRALTGPCRFYHFKGYCNSGDACLFSHAEATDEQKKVVEANILACRFYHLTKNCKQGDDCFYLHGEATPEQIEKLKK